MIISMKKCVLYNNISEEYLDLPLCPLSLYAKQNNFEIADEFKPEIIAFNTEKNGYIPMISFLKENKDILDVIFYSEHSFIISYLEYLNLISLDNINLHFIKENSILNTQDKDELLNLVVENYIQNLSQRIAINIEYYISRGQMPFKPPFGYKRVRI